MTLLRSPREIFYNPTTGNPLSSGALRLVTLGTGDVPTSTPVTVVYGLDGAALRSEEGIYALGTDGGGQFDIRVSCQVELLTRGYADVASPAVVGSFLHKIPGSAVDTEAQLDLTPSDTIEVFNQVVTEGEDPDSLGKIPIEQVYFSSSKGFLPTLDYDQTVARINDADLPISAYEGIRVVNTHDGVSGLYQLKSGSIAIAGYTSTEAQTPSVRFLNVEPAVSSGWADHWDDLSILKDGAVLTSMLADAQITRAKLGLLAVGTGNLGALSVTGPKLGLLSVGTGNLKDTSVTNPKIDFSKLTHGIFSSPNFIHLYNAGGDQIEHTVSVPDGATMLRVTVSFWTASHKPFIGIKNGDTRVVGHRRGSGSGGGSYLVTDLRGGARDGFNWARVVTDLSSRGWQALAVLTEGTGRTFNFDLPSDEDRCIIEFF